MKRCGDDNLRAASIAPPERWQGAETHTSRRTRRHPRPKQRQLREVNTSIGSRPVTSGRVTGTSRQSSSITSRTPYHGSARRSRRRRNWSRPDWAVARAGCGPCGKARSLRGPARESGLMSCDISARPASALAAPVLSAHDRNGDYAEAHTSEESPRIMARRRRRRLAPLRGHAPSRSTVKGEVAPSRLPFAQAALDRRGAPLRAEARPWPPSDGRGCRDSHL